MNQISQIDVLAGDCTDNICEMVLPDVIESALGVKSVQIVVSLREQEIREMAATRHFHMAVLVMNNIIYAGAEDADIAVRISRGLELIRALKEQHQLPVFVLVGYGQHLGAVERSLEAGASFAAKIPCDTHALTAAIAEHVTII